MPRPIGTPLKPVVWVGSAKRDLSAFPKAARSSIGHGLLPAQLGQRHRKAKALKGFGGAAVVELIAIDEHGTFRAVYTTKYEDGVYVLHAFQKKSKTGIATPQTEIDLVKARFRETEPDPPFEAKDRVRTMPKRLNYEVTEGNVLEAIGFSPQHALRGELVGEVQRRMKAEGLTQAAAAKRMGVKQPDLSRALNGHYENLSIERILRMLTALDYEVDVVVRRRGKSRSARVFHVPPL